MSKWANEHSLFALSFSLGALRNVILATFYLKRLVYNYITLFLEIISNLVKCLQLSHNVLLFSLMILKLYKVDNVKQKTCKLIITILSYWYHRSQIFSYGVLWMKILYIKQILIYPCLCTQHTALCNMHTAMSCWKHNTGQFIRLFAALQCNVPGMSG